MRGITGAGNASGDTSIASNATGGNQTAATTGNGTAGNQTAGNGTAAAPASGGIVVSIVQGAVGKTIDAYDPNPIQIKAGDAVTWTNNDSAAHGNIGSGRKTGRHV